MRHGVELAVDEINAAGGFLGRPIELVVRDDKADPDTGRAAAIDLVTKEKVTATIGFCNTGVALKALDVFESNQSVLVVPCATGSAVTHTTPADRSMVFRVAPVDTMNADFLVREIVDRRRLKRVALLADSTGYGSGGVKDITAQLKAHGLEPAYVGRFPLGVRSLKDEIDAARAAGAQALVAWTVGPEQAVAVKARAEARWDVPYLAPWPLSFRSVMEAAKAPALEGTMMTQSIIQDSANERRASFIAHYYKRHPEDRPIGSLMAAAQAYDATNLLVRAMFRTHGELTGPALKTALENATENEIYRGVVSSYEHPFSAEDHDAFSERMIWLGVWRGGVIQYYYPQDAKLSAAVRRK
jgi:branched-chain amino acid transport system substrate-binding protein